MDRRCDPRAPRETWSPIYRAALLAVRAQRGPVPEAELKARRRVVDWAIVRCNVAPEVARRLAFWQWYVRERQRQERQDG